MDLDQEHSLLDKLFGLSEKVVVITGSAGQLGSQYLHAFLDAGARVAGCDIKQEDQKSQPQSKGNDRLISVKMDVTPKMPSILL